MTDKDRFLIRMQIWQTIHATMDSCGAARSTAPLNKLIEIGDELMVFIETMLEEPKPIIIERPIEETRQIQL